MPKKSRKTGSPTGPRVRAGSRSGGATKGLASAATPAAAERIARALEVIAAAMSSAAERPDNHAALTRADAFVWHPDGRLMPVPQVS
ncbi:MAG TPA: AAA family ATPase, partial [Nitrobacter sp.]|nr:AAA family ATPase [Nitrobacter sp.]